jgi:predicted nucleotidyltransferase
VRECKVMRKRTKEKEREKKRKKEKEKEISEFLYGSAVCTRVRRACLSFVCGA